MKSKENGHIGSCVESENESPNKSENGKMSCDDNESISSYNCSDCCCCCG